MSHAKEIWKDVKNYEGYYQISSHGRLKNNDGLIRKCRPDKNGYRIVDLFKDGKVYTTKIHREVLKAFVGNPPKNRNLCDHIDRKVDNNKLENLRWVSHTESLLNRKDRASKSGYRGIRLRRGNQWQVYTNVKGKFKHIAAAKTLKEALKKQRMYEKTRQIVGKR